MQAFFPVHAGTCAPSTMGRPSTKPRGAFGQHLLALRERAGLTQQQLGQKLGVPASNIAFWERWDKPPRGEILPKLAAALDVSLDELMGAAAPKAKRAAPKGRLSDVFAQAAKLPKRQQAKLAEFVQLFLAQNAPDNRKAS
ncbi:MAG: helix-turn-helix domain-containing protein [Opitutaceae bacterium]